jgi:NAD(P)-dependent dehydrogenase (short-subunit alcohol dehydrogenase family)
MGNMFSLEAKVAFVTGAARGIGLAIATGWAEAGADIACFDFDRDGADQAAASIRQLGRQAIGIGGDVTDAGSVADAVALTARELGGVHIALNNAGIAHQAPAEDLTADDWRHMIDVNLTGVFLTAQAEARVMLAGGGGSIVNIASMSGTIVNRGLAQAHYNASKAGVMHLTKSLAVEWARRGIRVNSLSPGYTVTPMTERPQVAAMRPDWESQTPMGRMVQMSELVGPAIFLASDASSACTGADLIVDCGFVCW